MQNPNQEMEQPLGDVVSGRPASAPQHVNIRGRLVNLVPPTKEHNVILYDLVGKTEHSHLWTYLPDFPFDSPSTFDAQMSTRIQSSDPLFFTVLNLKTLKVAGQVSYLRIDPANRVIELGHILFAEKLQRTREATEVFYLLLKHAFDDLGYRRVEWKCNSLNAPSRRAALRLGYQFEGIFRQHMIVKGRNRDTAWFAILDGDWPAIKSGLIAWLDDGNFDDEGKQRVKLEVLRERCRDKMSKAE